MYLIVLFFIPRHVIVNITASAFNSKNSITNGRYHIQLLDNRVHVACSPSIFEPHKTLGGPRSNWRQILPFCKCFTTCKINMLYIHIYNFFFSGELSKETKLHQNVYNFKKLLKVFFRDILPRYALHTQNLYWSCICNNCEMHLMYQCMFHVQYLSNTFHLMYPQSV